MLVAFPVLEPAGQESVVSPHFGHAPYFAVVDDLTGSSRFFATAAAREEGECAPLRALTRVGVREVHCVHMGRGALRRCFEAGLRVYQCEPTTIRAALAKRARDGAPDLPDDALCAGHEGHHESP